MKKIRNTYFGKFNVHEMYSVFFATLLFLTVQVSNLTIVPPHTTLLAVSNFSLPSFADFKERSIVPCDCTKYEEMNFENKICPTCGEIGRIRTSLYRDWVTRWIFFLKASNNIGTLFICNLFLPLKKGKVLACSLEITY
jgi:hypothetical protein